MIRVPINCVVKKDNFLFLFARDVNAILRFDMITKKNDIIGFVPDEIKSMDVLFSSILIWRDNFVFVPYNAQDLWMVDMNFSHWNKIELKHKDVKMKFAGAVIVDDKLFLLKHAYPTSIFVDLNYMKIEEMQNMSQDSFVSAYLIDNGIYCPSISRNKLIVYDIVKSNYSEISVGEENTTYNYLLYDNNKFFLVPREGTDIIVMQGEKEIDKIRLPEQLYPRNIFYYENELYIPSSKKGKSIKMRDGKIEKIEREEAFVFSERIDEKIYCLTDDRGFIYLFDEKSKSKIPIELEVNEFVEKIGKDAFYGKNRFCKEGVFRNLENFVDMLEEPISSN